jgi:hypothetical protein
MGASRVEVVRVLLLSAHAAITKTLTVAQQSPAGVRLSSGKSVVAMHSGDLLAEVIAKPAKVMAVKIWQWVSLKRDIPQGPGSV